VRVLGVDPGARVTGYGVIDADTVGYRHITSGVIRVPAGALGARLNVIHQGLSEIIRDADPEIMAVEKVFISRNIQSALILGQARGAAIVAGANAGLTISEYSPLEIKQAVVGRGRAAKQQVAHMVKVLLCLQGQLVPDASDALACALCHINTALGRQRVALRMGRGRAWL